MLRVNQIKCKPGCSEDAIKKKTAEFLRVSEKEIRNFSIVRRSIDARKKPNIFYIYTVDVEVQNEEKILKKFAGKENFVQIAPKESYQFPASGKESFNEPIVIVGTGPAGLFCGYFLALYGYRPILLERGKCVDERAKDVEEFWKSGILNPASNVQFGEGGAGTFSDGKLNTLVKDKDGRNRAVLETFVKFGAPKNILYDAKPHIGTDILRSVVKGMREDIILHGGHVFFESQVTNLVLTDGKVSGVVVNDEKTYACSQLVLAIGHSARDTFSMLYDRKIPMEAKSFAVGFRVQHPQALINESQYGMADPGELGAAPYKVTAKAKNGRAVYSFCMCPGGYVVNASSEEGRTAVNGMSYSGRNGESANSAIIVAVTPEDFGDANPLSGIKFQRELEEKAYLAGGGKIPAQRFGDFCAAVAKENLVMREVDSFFENEPSCKGDYIWTDLSDILPVECNEALIDGMDSFGKQIKGFDSPDAVFLGVESRTSSPVRIPRNENLEAEVVGLYPCGEGAGYAGGITSAAMDGMRVAEKIAQKYQPFVN